MVGWVRVQRDGAVTTRRWVSSLLMFVLCWGLVACGENAVSPPEEALRSQTAASAIAEAAPPLGIRTLTPLAAVYQPQVQIVTPPVDTILPEPRVEVTLAVQDLPIFKDKELELGPHLQVILDNQPPVSVYSLTDPVVFEDVTAGTHLLRVFAVTPWGESFKNEGAYAQSQFSVLTGDRNHQPNPNLPLLTYNSPQGLYSAQPLLLDFFLSNAPLSLVESNTAAVVNNNWRVRVTVNDQSFLLDDWQSLYLEGFKPGLNWVKLEFLSTNGQPIDNVFNNMVRIVDYQPDQTPPLAALMTNVLAPEVQGALFDPTYRDRTAPPAAAQKTQPIPADVIPPDTVDSALSLDAGEEEDSLTELPAESQTPDFPLEESSERASEPEDDASILTPDAPADAATEQSATELEPPLLLDEQGVPVVVPPAPQQTAQPEPEGSTTEDERPSEAAPEQTPNVAPEITPTQPNLSSAAATTEVAPESTPEPMMANPTTESVEPIRLPTALPPEP